MIDLNELIDDSIPFQMSIAEKTSLIYLLNKLPVKKTALEIGTFYGGSLNIISKYFNKVYSCDLTHENIDKTKYNNVEWITGDSNRTIPKLIEKINQNNEEINFILIDGNHEYEYVLNDINNILKYNIKNDLLLLIHDSWYSPSRLAICHSKLISNPNVCYVNTDWCSGDLMFINGKNQFMGGICLAMLSKDNKLGTKVQQSQDYMYKVVNEIFK